VDVARSTTSSNYLSATVKQPSSNFWSFAAWVYFQTLPTASTGLIALSQKATTNAYFGIGINWTGSAARAASAIAAGGSEIDAFATSNFTATGTWYLVGGTFNSPASSCAVFLNGGSSGTAAISGIPTVCDTVGVGTLANGGGFISHTTGWIAECAIWRAILTAQEFRDMYFCGRPVGTYRPGSLFFYSPLRGLSAGTEPDLGPYRNNLTLTGPPSVAPHPPVYLPRNQLKLANPGVGSATRPLPPRLIRPLNPHGQYDRWDYYP
jgi:hypothetical protein